MKKVITFIFLGIFCLKTFGQDFKVPCRNLDGSLGLNIDKKVDCKLASKIVHNDLKLKEEFVAYADKKIAKKIAQGLSEAVEDIALLDSFFEQSGISLTDHGRVMSSCKLEQIVKPECGIGFNQKKIDERLNLVKNNPTFLPKLNSKSHADTLLERLQFKGTTIRDGGGLKNFNGQCPVEGSSGAFILSSFLGSSDASRMIRYVQQGNKKIINNNFQDFPHLKLLSVNKELNIQFEEYLKKYDSSLRDEKKYVDSFFKSVEVQKKLGDELANKCSTLKLNIKKFVCQDSYNSLVINEEGRDFLFNDQVKVKIKDGNDKLDVKEDVIFKEVARGLSCELENAQEKNDDENLKNDKDPFLAERSIGKLLSTISPNLREEKFDSFFSKITEPFCNKFLCKDDSIKSDMLSCKNGGPISSYDYLKTCDGNENLKCEEIKDNISRVSCFNEGFEKCSASIQKELSYLKMKERDAINSGNIPKSLAGIESSTTRNSNDGTSSAEATKPKGFSSFYQNFLGVEGTLLAEGKKITPETIATKSEEFIAKKLDSASTSTNLLAKNDKITEENSATSAVAQATPSQAQSQSMVNHANGMMGKDDDELEAIRLAKEALQKALIEKHSKSSGGIAKANVSENSSQSGSDHATELKRLRDDLNGVVGSMKGTQDEQLATIARANQAVGNTHSAKTTTPSNVNSFKNEAERERLKNWESKLRDWSDDLSDRETRAFMGGGSPRSSNNGENQRKGLNDRNTASNSDESSSSSSGSSPSLRLSKSSATGTGVEKGGAKGIEGQSDGSGVVTSDILMSSEKLLQLKADGLSNLGISSKESFVIRVRHQNKIYAIPVKNFTHEGKSMYVPLLSDSNQELASIVMESPLFADYRTYQASL